MAEEPKVQEITPEAQAAKSKSASPWIPVVVLLLLLPALSFAMTQWVLIPSMKNALEGALRDATAQATQRASEHGGQEAPEGPVRTKAFRNIIANLSGSVQSRYIKISFTAEGKTPEFDELMERFEPKIIDATLGILSSLTLADLEKTGVQNTIRSDLITAFANVLKKDVVTHIYFTEFVVQ
jgi:flagellar FliL protein